MSQDSIDHDNRMQKIKNFAEEFLCFLHEKYEGSPSEPTQIPELKSLVDMLVDPMQSDSPDRFQFDIDMLSEIVPRGSREAFKSLIRKMLRAVFCVSSNGVPHTYVVRESRYQEAPMLMFNLSLELRQWPMPENNDAESQSQENPRASPIPQKRKIDRDDQEMRKKRKTNPSDSNSPHSSPKKPKKAKTKAADLRDDLESDLTPRTSASKDRLSKRRKKRKKKRLVESDQEDAPDPLQTPEPVQREKRAEPPALDQSFEAEQIPDGKRFSDLSASVSRSAAPPDRRRPSDIDPTFSLSQPIYDAEPENVLLTQNDLNSSGVFSQRSEAPSDPDPQNDPPSDNEQEQDISTGGTNPEEPNASVTNPFDSGGIAHDELNKSQEKKDEFPEDDIDFDAQEQQSKPAYIDMRGDEDPPDENEDPESSKSSPSADEAEAETLPVFTVGDAQKLKEGDRIDLRDNVWRWLPAQVISVEQNKVKFHYIGYEAKYDEEIDVTYKFENMAPLHSRSRGDPSKFSELGIGASVDIYDRDTQKWYTGTIKKFHIAKDDDNKDTDEILSPQIQVKFSADNKTKIQIRWFDPRDPKELTGAGTETGKQKRRSSAASYSHGEPSSEKEKPWSNPWSVGQLVEIDRGERTWVPYEVDRIDGEILFLRGSYNATMKIDARAEKSKIRKATEEGRRSGELRKQKEILLFEKTLREVNKNWVVRRCKGDGNCLFRAVAWSVLGDQDKHKITRKDSVLHMWKNRIFYQDFFWDNDDSGKRTFLDKMKRRIKLGCIWGDHHDITALSELYNVNIHVYELEHKKARLTSRHPDPNQMLAHIVNELPTLNLFRRGRIHYDLIVDTEKGASIKDELKKQPNIMEYIKKERDKSMREEQARNAKLKKEREEKERVKKKRKIEPRSILEDSSDSDDDPPFESKKKNEEQSKEEEVDPLSSEKEEPVIPGSPLDLDEIEKINSAETEDGIKKLMQIYEGKSNPVKSEYKQSWICPSCTHENNDMTDLKCKKCRKERFDFDWACTKCTLFNKGKNRRCEACNTVHEIIKCPQCTLEYDSERSRCPSCGLRNPAARNFSFGSSRRQSGHRRDDDRRKFASEDYDFSESEEVEYDSDIFDRLVWDEEANAYQCPDTGKYLRTDNEWLEWYDDHENDYIVVVGSKSEMAKMINKADRTSSFHGPSVLAGKKRSIVLVAYGVINKQTEEEGLFKQLDKSRRNQVRESFHFILKRVAQLSNRNEADPNLKKKVYLLEDKRGKVRYGSDPVFFKRRYSSSGFLQDKPTLPKHSTKPPRSINGTLNKLWFKELKEGTLTHQRIQELGRGIKATQKKKRKRENGGGRAGKRKKRRTDADDDPIVDSDDEVLDDSDGFLADEEKAHNRPTKYKQTKLSVSRMTRTKGTCGWNRRTLQQDY